MSPLPTTPNLDALVTADTNAVTIASAAIASGAAAAAKLTALKSQLDDIVALQTQYTTEMNDGTNRLTDTQTAANGFATGAYASTIAAIKAVATGGLGNPAWKAVVALSMSFTGVNPTTGVPGPVTGTYSDFVTAKALADTTLLTKQNTVTARRIDADTARKQLDAALAALATFLTGVEADLTNAQKYFNSAKLQVSSHNFAGAWWSWFLADALVTGIDAEDDSPLMTALNTAVEKYAKAVTDLNAANADVATAVALQSRAAYNLNIADNKVRVALAATAPA